MTLDSGAVRAQVDQYFDRLAEREQTYQHPDIPIPNEPDPISLLKLHNEKLPEEDYEKLSEAIAADPRIKPYLPGIAFRAMVQDTEMAQKFGPDWSVSEDALLNAIKDERRFDPVHREALKFVASNFDRLRDFDKKDANGFGITYNHDNLTWRDLSRARGLFLNYFHSNSLIAADQFILKNFDTIDTSRNGAISYKEGHSWLNGLIKENCPGPSSTDKLEPFAPGMPCRFAQFLKMELPHKIERQLPGSEQVTREAIEKRIEQLRAMRTSIAKDWGFEQAK